MKNLLKSIFISALPVFALIIFVKTLIQFDNNLTNVGLLLNALPIIIFFSSLFIKPVARTSTTLTSFTVPVIIGTAVTLFTLNLNAIVISVALALGWFLYLTWYSKFEKRDQNTIQVGKKLPPLTFENIQKQKVNLTEFDSDYKVLLFFRGNWCPLCMAQIKEIANEYQELAKRNTEIFLISSQPHKFTESLAKKYNVPFHYLTDKNNENARRLNILHENGLPMGFQVFGYESDVIMPTVIITNKMNEVIFADLTDNYRVRPEPATFLKIIDKKTL
ncbi:redoxin domain-containing protein [Tenacibaculum jejuense]|uniref:thioredoxin-dependent peroxiredoxin n=1 Tax=Tenacibaculum jejuense TaxID=584609 RepID=A0A238U740_9FLAO|nr:redoxin domain-containing protein [Tenacibaculum jejuense]SNR14977.1 Antioxidant, AhpC/TSA family [Tenacibaculum jejuense]